MPVYRHAIGARERFVDLDLPMPVLVLWNGGRTEVDIFRTARQHWHFHGHAHHFDLYAAGHFEAISVGDEPADRLVVTFPPVLLQSWRDARPEAGLGQCRFQFADRVLERLVRTLATQAEAGEPLGPVYARSLSLAILERLGGAAGGSDPGDRLPARTRAILVELVGSRLANPPSIDDLARVAGLRTSEFIKAFRQAFGSTPHQYLLDRRIERARELLRLDRPLITIALELGFASHAHFSASFRSRTGCTPSEYRAGLHDQAHPPVAAPPEYS